MFNYTYSTALLMATYKDGKIGRPTSAHERAEHHRFKTEYLFKHKEIPKALYVSRLIQHLTIIQALETQLQNLSKEKQSEINAFFALSYLESLWRIPGIQKDLQSLNVNTDKINDNLVAKTTKKYLKDIETLTPKELLIHFLLHVAGFMHGGNIIRIKHINPSNKLTEYQISTHQYDFSAIEKGSSIEVYNDLMKQIDEITLNEQEYQDIFTQGQKVYHTMASIYEDLCDMHINQQKSPYYAIAIVSVSMIAIALVLKLLVSLLNPTINHNQTLSRGPV